MFPRLRRERRLVVLPTDMCFVSNLDPLRFSAATAGTQQWAFQTSAAFPVPSVFVALRASQSEP
jgi:hypothetical protein